MAATTSSIYNQFVQYSLLSTVIKNKSVILLVQFNSMLTEYRDSRGG